MRNFLKKLVENSQMAINDGIYEINENLEKSKIDLIKEIKESKHAPLITEVKFSSPSMGEISTIKDPITIAKSMISGGAKALSVLTQPHMFNGSPEYFISIRKVMSVPMLMKDIIIDKCQIDAAQKMGADYILLIQSLFDLGHLKEIDEFIDYGQKKDLRIILEAHTKEEFTKSVRTKADLIGINNRDLDTLEIDLSTTKKVLNGYKKSRLILSESGIESPNDIKFLRDSGADVFLVGTSIMKTENIEENVKKLVNAI